MMGCSPRCYIPSFVKIGLMVLEKKIFEGFLPYMGVAATLVTLKLALIGKAVSEKKIFEHCERRRMMTDDDDDRRTPDQEYPISSLMSLWLR